MKKIFILAVATLALVSCKKEGVESNGTTASTEVKKDQPVAEAKKATMKIEGMTCAMGCAKVIENKLGGLDGVQKATVDFDKKEATIEYDAQVQTIETLSKTVEEVADGKTYKVKEAKNI
ncbi:MAG: heavy metal-associated domain-containing protein [Bacteroidota bacterium]